MSFFTWKLWNKGVQTNGRIKKCFIPLASKCYYCIHEQKENDDHSFANGDLVEYLWEHASKIFGLVSLVGPNRKQRDAK